MSDFSIFGNDSFTRTRYTSQEEAFMKNLPDTLYLSHYDLANMYTDWTPDQWRRFLKEKERFIMTEVAAMTESSARLALSRLSTGKLTTQEVSAIRQLLERSEQINAADKDQRTFVMLQFDGTEKPKEGQLTRQQLGQLMLQNDNNVRKVYETYPDDSYRIRNADNTLHFTNISRLTEADKIYMRLFNPNNERVDKLPEIYEPEGYDVQ